MKTALLLIDLQHDFMPGGSLAVADGDAVVAIANRLMPRYAVVVASQDWHPANHGSFASQHPDGAPFAMGELDGQPQILWPDHCVQGTPGASFHSALNVAGITHVQRKGSDPLVDSYSAFFDNGHRVDTGLTAWLRAQEVEQVDIMGLALDVCVAFTGQDARRQGFATRLLLPGCRAVNMSPDDGDKAVADLRKAGVQIVETTP